LVMLYPMLFTVYMAFTNYSDGHLLTKPQVLEQLRKVQYLPEEGKEYSWTAFRSEEGEFALWLNPLEGEGSFLAFPDQPLQPAEELAPEAKGIIFTNPEDRLAYAVNKYTDLEAYGYCDGNWDFRDHFLGELLDLPGERIHLEGAGINHMVWITELRDRETGQDLYPEMVQRAEAENWQPLSRHLYRTYGLWPHENDSHVGEYIGYAPEFNDCSGYDFDGHLKEEKKWRNRMKKLREGDYEIEEFVAELSDYEHHTFGDASFTKIIKGEVTEENPFLSGANLINKGKISNLPDDMVVEVPAVVTYSGINGFSFGDLPDAITSLTHREGVVQKLSAEAAVEGSREKALRALDLDDIVPDPETGRKLLESFLNEHAEYVRGF